MAALDREKSCWTLYPPLLSILKTERERNYLEEAAMAYRCGRFADARALFNHNLPLRSTIPMLAMEHADLLTTQGVERERIKILEATLHNHEVTNDRVAIIERLLLELMLLDALGGLLYKARQIRKLVSQVAMEHLSYLEVGSTGFQSASVVVTVRLNQIRAITLYYQVINCCKTVSNFVKPQHETIFDKSGNRALEVRRLRESLVKRGNYNRAATFMQIELTLVQGLEMQASVAASLGLCNAMEQTQDKSLLFHAAKLGRQISGILANVIPQMGEQASQHSAELLKQIFPQIETQCPGVFFDHAIKVVRDSPSTGGEKSRRYMDLSNQAKERMDFTRANQTLIAARDAAQESWHQCKTLPSAHTALQQLHDCHTAYIEFHQSDTGMDFFESAGIFDYLSTLSVHYKDNHKILRLVEDCEGKHPDFGIPTHQERIFDLAAGADRKLSLKDQLEQYDKQRFKWLRQCPFSDQDGRLTESALSDPDQYLRQIFHHTHDPVRWGANALQLVLYWAKIEREKGLLTAGALRELFGFLQTHGQGDDPNLLFRYTKDLESEEAADEATEEAADEIAEESADEAARCLYGVPDEPTPSVTFLNIMQRLTDWLNLPSRPPSQVARLGTAKVIMISRMHRHRLHLASKGIPDDTDISEYSAEQKMLDAIEKLEDAVGGEFGDQSDRQTGSRIQTTLTKCYVLGTVSKGLISDEELRSRISDCVALASKYANGGRRFLEYHTLLQQSRLQWQRYLLLKTIPPDACLEVLEKAEFLFNSTRKQLLTPSPADLLSATVSLTEEFMAQAHSKMGIMASFMSVLEDSPVSQEAQGQGKTDTKSQHLTSLTYERFLKWTHRSKGRGLVDLLYFDFEIVQDLVATLGNDGGNAEASNVESDLSLSVENLQVAENITLQDRTEQAKPPTNKVTPIVLSEDVTDDTIVSKAMIDKMLSEVGDNVVLVDIINIAYLGGGGSQAILYRKGATGSHIPLPDLTLQAVERWVGNNLGTQGKTIERPLSTEGYASELQKLTPLLVPLFDPELPQGIKEGEVIVFCLTGALHRIPIHAVPIQGKPMIESHPVTYCQSLTTVYRSYEAVRKFQPSTAGVESLAIIPTYKKPWMKEPKAEEKLLQEIEGISRDLNGKLYTGPALLQEKIQNALSDCGHFFYYGHVHYNSELPTHSAVLLNQSAYKDPSLKKPGSEGLTVRDLFKVQLHKPALATLIGCGSGQALISGLDDVLGLPTALLYAGASAIVSTLWSIDVDDGANFAVEFYNAVHQQQVNQKTDGTSADGESGLKSCVNLACAMHEAVKMLRQRGEQEKAAYHWAAFYLTGFWLFPPLAIK